MDDSQNNTSGITSCDLKDAPERFRPSNFDNQELQDNNTSEKEARLPRFVRYVVSITSGILSVLIILAIVFLLKIMFFESFYLGNEEDGIDIYKNSIISVDDALNLAEPYLSQTYTTRTERGENTCSGDSFDSPKTHVILKGNYYYLVKDACKDEKADFYMSDAVKVHKETGNIVISK